MLKFLVFEDGQPPEHMPLINAHLLGADNIGVRGQIRCADGQIICEKRAMGAAALALQFSVPDIGELTLQTCLLPEREEPYLLSLELARHRLMTVLTKQEEWLMFELGDDHPAMRRMSLAHQLFVKALSATDDPPAADRLARESLAAGIDASEELALAHADLLLNRRRMTGGLPRGTFGCGVGLSQNSSEVRSSILANFDFLRLPTRWRHIEPQEQQLDWTLIDGWAEWAYRNRLPIMAGPIISVEQNVMPDWLYVVEHDYESLRDLFYEHTERLVNRYRNVVSLWNVISGLHVNAHFMLTLEHLMDLTRMAVMLVRKIQPQARILVEITQPFGEYYAANQRSIPPLTYADMILQAGIPIDAFGVRLLMGRAVEGQYTRDLMQISSLLDRFSGLGKPVHVTAAAVPSQPIDEQEDSGSPGLDPSPPPGGSSANGGFARLSSGYWRKPWSVLVQSHWLEAMYNIALSKPFVESVTWLDLADHAQSDLPHAGLAMSNLKTKNAFHRVVSLRKALLRSDHDERSSPAGS
jgi:hypothetical protein